VFDRPGEAFVRSVELVREKVPDFNRCSSPFARLLSA
jgi:hypothetical protein